MIPPQAMAAQQLTNQVGTVRARGLQVKPITGEITQAQNTLDGGSQDEVDRRHLIAAGFGEVVGDPAVLLPGDYTTWRLMDAHPTLTLARAVVSAPVLASKWTWKKRDGLPDSVLKFVKEMFDPLRPSILKQSLRATSMGWAPHELVWELKQIESGDGTAKVKEWRYVIKKFKPLSREMTWVYTHPMRGHFCGLHQGAVWLNSLHCWVYTNDAEMVDGNFYGRPRHENCREEYCESRFLATTSKRLANKVSGIIPIIRYIKGLSKNAANEPINNLQAALTLIAGLADAKGVAFESLAHDIDDIRNQPDLLKQSAMEIDTVDIGSSGQSIDQMTGQREYIDKLFMRAWSRPERSALEALTGGSRADSDSATDISISDSEQLHQDIAKTLNWHAIDDLLAVNFGEEYRGSVWCEPAPILDQDRAILLEIFKGVMANVGLFEQAWSEIDQANVFERLNVPRLPGVARNATEPTPAPKPEDAPPDPASAAAIQRTYANAT